MDEHPNQRPATVVRRRATRRIATITAALIALAPMGLAAQWPKPLSVAGRDSVTAVASKEYDAGPIRRFLLGADYRDLWSTPVRVPVLNLRTFAGGIRPTKEGGGAQTRSLRLETSNGVEYTFRVLQKDRAGAPPKYDGLIPDWPFRDQVAAIHPGAALAAAPLVERIGALHVWPVFVVMPDDSLLGEFRKDYAGRFGMIEEYPGNRDKAPGFGGADSVVDAMELLEFLNEDPTQYVDARILLRLRLLDMLIGDSDRSVNNIKWARMPETPGLWVPVPRDRDRVFNTYEGPLLAVVRRVEPRMVTFKLEYPKNLAGLNRNGRDADSRLLTSLAKPAWDSAVADVKRRITNGAIDSAMRAMPAAYGSRTPEIVAKLRARRDNLQNAADRYYRMLSELVDVHGSDEPDHATIRRLPDGDVEVRVESQKARVFVRRFNPRDTKEIRVHLHGGDDTAMITGDAEWSIPVRVTGGNGTNTLVDSSHVAGRGSPTRLYDVGTVRGVTYGADSLYNRQPWVKEDGDVRRWGQNWGNDIKPIFGISSRKGLGITPKVGIARYTYGFRHEPYSSVVELEGEYATRVGGFRLALSGDKRLEESRLHFTTLTRMSELEMINFYGFGNETSEIGREIGVYEVRQRQWMVRPAVAFSLGARSDVSLGPTVQYSTTEDVPGRLISLEQPYGSGRFGQAGVQFTFHHELREWRNTEHDKLELDFNTGYFPALWDVTSPFTSMSARAGVAITLPVPTHPMLVVRTGAKKVFGDVPFHEAAFLGGNGTTRFIDAQRYAGDAAVFATTELRVPVARFSLGWPLVAGVVGVADAGRVYVDGASPGGWHAVAGGGLFIGLQRDQRFTLSFLRTNEDGRTGIRLKRALTF